MRLVDRDDEKIIYSDNGQFLTEYVLVHGCKSVGSNANCIGYDYLFIVDQRYKQVVGMLDNASKFSPNNKEMFAKIKSIILNYERKELIEDNAIQFLFEEKLCDF